MQASGMRAFTVVKDDIDPLSVLIKDASNDVRRHNPRRSWRVVHFGVANGRPNSGLGPLTELLPGWNEMQRCRSSEIDRAVRRFPRIVF
jgi:hypothetical protein